MRFSLLEGLCGLRIARERLKGFVGRFVAAILMLGLAGVGLVVSMHCAWLCGDLEETLILNGQQAADYTDDPGHGEESGESQSLAAMYGYQEDLQTSDIEVRF